MKLNFWILIALLLCTGCSTPGLKRVPMDAWHRVDVPQMRFSLELPKGRKVGGWFDKKDDQILIVSFHYWCSGSAFADDVDLLTVYAHRLSPSVYDKYRTKTYGFVVIDDKVFSQESLAVFNSELQTRKIGTPPFDRQYLYFRKDYRAPNGDLILTGAKMTPRLFEHGIADQEKDRKAIERILNSFQIK